MKQAMEVLRPESPAPHAVRAAYDILYAKLRNEHYATLLTSIANEAFSVINKNIKFWDQYHNILDETSVLNGIREKLKEIPKDPKMKIEAAGSWLWISGNTYDNKEELKAIGFRFNRDRRMWYWSEAVTKKYDTEKALGQ